MALSLGLGETVPWVSLLDRLRLFPQTLLSAFETAQLSPNDSDATSAISKACSELSLLTADVVHTPHRRPLLSFWTEVERLIDLLWHLDEVYLQAFDAPTPLWAQQLQQEGQGVLDQMVRHSDAWIIGPPRSAPPRRRLPALPTSVWSRP